MRSHPGALGSSERCLVTTTSSCSLVPRPSGQRCADPPSASAECGREMTDRVGTGGRRDARWAARGTGAVAREEPVPALHRVHTPAPSLGSGGAWGSHGWKGRRPPGCPVPSAASGRTPAGPVLPQRQLHPAPGPGGAPRHCPHSTAPARPQASRVTCLAKVRGQRQRGRGQPVWARGGQAEGGTTSPARQAERLVPPSG